MLSNTYAIQRRIQRYLLPYYKNKQVSFNITMTIIWRKYQKQKKSKAKKILFFDFILN